VKNLRTFSVTALAAASLLTLGCATAEVSQQASPSAQHEPVTPGRSAPIAIRQGISGPPMAQLNGEAPYGLRLIHEPCMLAPERADVSLDLRPYIEFGVATTFEERGVHPFFAYRCK
jgi:hypothetical protein